MKKRKKVIFLGDSITDAGHNFETPVPGKPCLGDGYVKMTEELLKQHHILQIDLLNCGHDGFTVSALLRMLEHDCLSRDPDIVSILIGSNDAAVCMNTENTLEKTEFRKNYGQVLDQIRNRTNAQIVCFGPFIFPWPLAYRNWIPMIRQIEVIEKEEAQRRDIPFIPLHDRLNREAQTQGYDAITQDGIHLTQAGAEILAQIWVSNCYKFINRT